MPDGSQHFSTVVVGTTVADRPPHRSVRARLRIRLLPRMSGGEAGIRISARSVSSGACEMERCSPQSAPFPPQPPQKTDLPCSAGSPVLRHSPTSPVRSRPPFGLWPSRTGLDRVTKTCRRYPGSRACCFSACAGSQTTQDLTIHSRFTWLSCCLPPLGMESASCSIGFSKLNSPAHQRSEEHTSELQSQSN